MAKSAVAPKYLLLSARGGKRLVNCDPRRDADASISQRTARFELIAGVAVTRKLVARDYGDAHARDDDPRRTSVGKFRGALVFASATSETAKAGLCPNARRWSAVCRD